ncbi:hypothetical protein B296_00037374 [Ensete ventricosum]|uniref:Uncharacterized protein n=1 Tax=Ensete ventricosum TaxID=4639 RepID=A0A426ZZR3_ENSVE|nr:hypothetical protein B296_00037374 [Ensete ventricosum]
MTRCWALTELVHIIAIVREGKHGHEHVEGGGKALLAHGGEFRVGANQRREGEQGMGKGILNYDYDRVRRDLEIPRVLLPREWDGGVVGEWGAATTICVNVDAISERQLRQY